MNTSFAYSIPQMEEMHNSCPIHDCYLYMRGIATAESFLASGLASKVVWKSNAHSLFSSVNFCVSSDGSSCFGLQKSGNYLYEIFVLIVVSFFRRRSSMKVRYLPSPLSQRNIGGQHVQRHEHLEYQTIQI